jgi:N-acyl-D-amino-acid deacylase
LRPGVFVFDATSCARLLLAFLFAAGASPASQLIVGAQVADGTGAPARRADVRIDADRIVAVGKLRPAPGEEVVDAGGRVLAPGFIDTHSHHDLGLDQQRDAAAAVSQGITTIVVGQDGSSQFPLQDFFKRLDGAPGSVNVASYSGHGTLREQVLGEGYKRHASAAEVDRMRKLLEEDLSAGAIGLSSGLEYDPGTYSDTNELVELARASARHGGRYISHMRSEDVKIDAAIDELLQIGRQACLPVQISHFKLALRTRWGEARSLLERLDQARASGVDVTADAYPYEYWQSTLTVLFPERNFTDRRTAEFALTHLAAPEDLTLSRFEADPSLVGRNVADIARQRGTDAPTTLMNLIAESQQYGKDGGEEMVIAKSMSDADIATLIAWPQTNISSDGMLNDRHPRGAGSFTLVLRKYVREQKLLTLEQAVHKMSGLPAAHIGLADRGVIRPGAYADLVLFDPATVTDHATIAQPQALSTGIERVWVNGQTVWKDEHTTQTYSGRTLRRSARAAPFTCKTTS